MRRIRDDYVEHYSLESSDRGQNHLELDRLVDQLVAEIKENNHTQGILIVKKEVTANISSHEFDLVILVISNEKTTHKVKHYLFNSRKIELVTFNNEEINTILINGNNRNLVDWLLNGTVHSEKDQYLTQLIGRIVEFPACERKFKMTIEFSKLIRRYVDGKKLYQQGHFLDAFNSILHSLHHLARLSVIEHGFYPEVTVWKQVKRFEPEVYKLYDELVMGEESLEKRLELLLIANNFALTSKTKVGASHLIEILKEEAVPLSIGKLSAHPEVKEYAIDLAVLIDYLVQKGLVDIVKEPTNTDNLFEQLYYVK